MNSQSWLRFLDEAGGVLLADGAMGTMLFDTGLESGEAPERWNLEQPDRVRSVHAAYLSAGSQLLLTNTFGANRFRLALHGLENRVAEINQAGSRSCMPRSPRPGGRHWLPVISARADLCSRRWAT